MIVFYSKEKIDKRMVLEGTEWQHCQKVIRKKMGDELFVIDGKGRLYRCTLSLATKNKGEAEILECVKESKFSKRKILAIAPTKNISRTEWVIEKSVELGISEICLFISQQSERRRVNLERLNKILLSAAKQSLQLWLPKLSFYEKMEEVFDAYKDVEVKFIAHCQNPEYTLIHETSMNSNEIVLIGPEGDFTSTEIESANKSGFRPVSLGDYRLRTETAGVVAAHILSLDLDQS